MPTLMAAAVAAEEREARTRSRYESQTMLDNNGLHSRNSNNPDSDKDVWRRRLLASQELNKKYAHVVLILAAAVFFLGLLAAGLLVKPHPEPVKLTTRQARVALLASRGSELAQCSQAFPPPSNRTWEYSDVGSVLYLTDLLDEEKHQEAADRARVGSSAGFGQTEAFSGFITVNYTTGSHLYFLLQVSSHSPSTAPLVVWLQGGPGWSAAYGAFKEVGAFSVWLEEGQPPRLEPRNEAWTNLANVLYLDCPVGTGWSYTEQEEGYSMSVQEAAIHLEEALLQITELLPYFVPGSPRSPPLLLFGEHFGAAFAIALAWQIEERKRSGVFMDDLRVEALGLGNAFLSARHQAVYTHTLHAVTYLSPANRAAVIALDRRLIAAVKNEDYEEAFRVHQESLQLITQQLAEVTNLHDWSSGERYLTDHGYLCYLEQAEVRRALHVGDRPLSYSGDSAASRLRAALMKGDSVAQLESVLGWLPVVLYHGQRDLLVPLRGTSHMVSSLDWEGREAFLAAEPVPYWVEEDGAVMLGGHSTTGGNLTLLVVRDAGGMVPISQPAVGLQILSDLWTLSSGNQTEFSGSVPRPQPPEQPLQCGG